MLANLYTHSSLNSFNFKKTIDFILHQQTTDGAITWYTSGKLDPWDHCEAAMALSIAGQIDAAQKAYHWLQKNQCNDGSWQANYFDKSASCLKETNFIAYIATGVWHYFLTTNDKMFLEELFPCVEAAIDCVLRYQTPDGDIAWAFNPSGDAEPDALLTACSSILRSIECALHCANKLRIDKPEWKTAWQQLKVAICDKPERFDRTWKSKARFAMDWYYPILGGAIAGDAAKSRIQNRWEEFVVKNLGCRCVNDEPWITMAESSELVMALVAANERKKALEIFNTLPRWQDEDGGYWTGYVFRDNSIWPEEKTSWTAAAVILAADALFALSPAATLFTQAGKID